MSDSSPPDETLADDNRFAEFRGWRTGRFASGWPDYFYYATHTDPRSEAQRRIAADNAGLLQDREAWAAKVARFEAALEALGDNDAIAKMRRKYAICFDGHAFGIEDKDFSGLTFPCSVSFDGASFGDGGVSFEGTVFRDGEVSFDGASFGHGSISFDWATFCDGDVSFHKTVFRSQYISFDEATFGRGVVSFLGAELGRGYISFKRATFGNGQVCFDDAVFGDGYIGFDEVNFGDGRLSFEQTMFGNGDVSFELTRFGDGTVQFNRATFGVGEVNFRRVEFGQGEVSFYGADLSKANLRFSGLHVRAKLDCTGLNALSAGFKNTTVDGLADWTDAKFGSIPDFRQMKLDRAPEVARMRVPKPAMVHVISEEEQTKRGLPKRDFWQQVAADGDDVLKLRKLKAMAIAANDHEKDGEFFAYEMMAKRGVEHTSFWQLLANTIYWKISFYGQSYLRPLAWMGGTFGVFAAIYTLMAALPIGGWNSLWFGITYSFKNSLPFLGTITRAVPSLDGHESWFAKQLGAFRDVQSGLDWLTVLGTGQAILSLFFFFFLLLGLRNRFRLK